MDKENYNACEARRETVLEILDRKRCRTIENLAELDKLMSFIEKTQMPDNLARLLYREMI